MDSKWLALIIPAASGALLLFGLAASSIASVAQQPSAPQPLPASDESGFCAVTPAAAPEVELCTATAKPAAESEAKECPVTGARGKSSLHLEEVMERVHRDVGACPHAKAPTAASECPYLRDSEDAPANTSAQRPQGTWL